MLIAAVGAGIKMGQVVDARLANAISAADRDDPHWRFEDLMAHCEQVPDDENAAILVEQAFGLIGDHWPERTLDKTLGTDPTPNRMARAFDRLQETPANVRLDDETAAVFREGLQNLAESVRIARRVADRPRGHHQLRITPALIDILLRETQNTRSVARMLSADAAILAHDGKIDEALETCRAILNVGRSPGDEPFLISGLVRVSIGISAMSSARRVLAQGEPSEIALTSWQALILQELAEPLLLRGMRGERGVLEGMIHRLAEGKIGFESLEGSHDPSIPVPRVPPWRKLALDNQRALGLEWMQAMVDIAKHPAADHPMLWMEWDAEYQKVKASPGWEYTSAFPVLMAPKGDAADQSQTRYQAELGAMAILVAAERHRRKHGDWPTSLEAIDRRILEAAPRDPYTGAPYHFIRGNGRFMVHSLGPDLEDDAGVYSPKHLLDGLDDDVGTGGWDVRERGQAPNK